MPPEMTSSKDHSEIKYGLVAFDPKGGYARLESKDGEHFIDYQTLPSNEIAVREGEQQKIENKNKILNSYVSYIKNDTVILYEPEYIGFKGDEETEEITQIHEENVNLLVYKRYENEIDIPLISATYEKGRLASALITSRRSQENTRDEIEDLRKAGIEIPHAITYGVEFVFYEENPEFISIIFTKLNNDQEDNPQEAVELEFEPENILNEYVIPDPENPDEYMVKNQNNTYAFRRLSWEDNSFWEITIPENLSFEEIHSFAISDEWTKLKDLHPVTITQGKDPSIYFP